MKTPILASLAPLCLLVFAPISPAGGPAPTSAAPDLVRLLPDDFALALVMRDLRGQARRWETSPWLAAFRKTAPGRALFEAPELAELRKAERELQRTFGIDWPGLRDDVLGDEVALAFHPGEPGRTDDEGLLLLRARRPERLAQLVNRLNEIQRKTGELKELHERRHQGIVYQRREIVGKQSDKDHYYFLRDGLLAVAGREATIRGVIERLQKPPASDLGWAAKFRRAGAGSAFLTLCVNPAALQPDFVKGPQKNEAARGYWRALEAVFLTLDLGATFELRLAVQARSAQLPVWMRSMFRETPTPSALWQRIPEQAVMAVATRTDFAASVSAFTELLPPPQRTQLREGMQRSLGAVTGLDVFKEILPNLGPDWGVCVLPPAQGQTEPQVLAALAVRPGNGAAPVDQALIRALNLFAGLAVLDHNKNRTDPIRLLTARQGELEVKYLAGGKTFPPGFQPAYTLKDGYLVAASAPEAIERFRAHATKAAPRGETPIVRVAPNALARLLTARREQVLRNLTEKQQMSRTQAERNLSNLIEVLGLLERVTVNQRGGAGQAELILRIHAAERPPVPRPGSSAEK